MGPVYSLASSFSRRMIALTARMYSRRSAMVMLATVNPEEVPGA